MMAGDLDLAIRGGTVIDGTGAPARRADVGVRGGRIVEIDSIVGPAKREIDASGLTVAPGFIDVHTHYDAQVFWDPMLSPSSNHGVTSVFGGNCGFSIAPLSGQPDDATYLMRMLSRVEGMPLESLEAGVPWSWTSFAEYLGKIDGKLGINAGFLVGHSALRRAVMGERAVGHGASNEEIDAMCKLLSASLAAGGLGFSTTLSRTHNDADGQPVPSRYASDAELIALAAVVGAYEGTWLEMVSDTGSSFSPENVSRMTEMSLAAGRALNWNVLSPNSRYREIYDNQLSASDYAAQRGARVIALAAPQPIRLVLTFEAGMVIDAIPGWDKVMALPIPERIRQLSDPAVRSKLNRTASETAASIGELADWSRWTIVETAKKEHKSLEGLTVGTLASRLNKAPLDTMLDIAIAEDLKTRLLAPPLGTDHESWQMLGAAWRDDRAIIGASDAGAHLDMIDTFAFSTQVLSQGVRERRLLSLEDAVYRMTDLPARTFGLRERGRIAPNYFADIIVFDPDTIACGPLHSRHDLPAGAARLFCEAVGVAHVVVNGEPIVTHGRHTEALPGKVLRSGSDTHTVAVAK